MNTRSSRRSQLVVLTVLACFCLSAFAFAADNTKEQVHPRFVVMPPHNLSDNLPPASLTEWQGNFTYNNHQYNYVMVGNNPANGSSTAVTTYIIPVKLVLSDGSVWDPTSGGPLGPLGRTALSPIFDKTTDYVQGGVDLGATQYEDAFQRGNFWSQVSASNPNYHVLLGGPSAHVTVLPIQTLNVPSQYGHQGAPFGHQVAEVSINWIDGQFISMISQLHQIQPNTFPIFMTYDTYLTQGGCCIGGYHSEEGSGQTYAHFTYIDHPGDFSQDVSALSHEVGEWLDDPLTNGGNSTPCGILEVGDPLETTNNYGSTHYTLHNFTYNLQDLTFIGYFGAPLSTSVNSWYTFQNYPFTQICQNGS